MDNYDTWKLDSGLDEREYCERCDEELIGDEKSNAHCEHCREVLKGWDNKFQAEETY